jgi:hypothetical protein
MEWETYNPTWLVDLARSQLPDQPWLAEALANCKACHWESPAYVHFVDPDRPNIPGSAWQFRENILLEHPTEGTLVLDVLQGGRIGGIEFLSRL